MPLKSRSNSELAPLKFRLYLCSAISHTINIFSVMAVSNGFFNLRRGSTKSLTFSVLNGKQVTKDRVSIVTNPKSEPQANQRMRMVSAKNFYRAFNGLLNHSFEGKKVGLQNYNEFMKLALQSNAGAYVPKGSNVFTPAAYMMAKGSLQAQNVAIQNVSNSRSPLYNSLAAVCTSLIAPTGDGINSVSGWLAANAWMKGGDQLTFIWVTKIQDAAGELANYTPNYIRGYVSEVDDTRTNTQKNVDFIKKLTEANLNPGGNSGDAASPFVFGPLKSGGTVICAAAVIVSRADVSRSDPWMRSTSSMAVSEELEGIIHSEEAYTSSVRTYMMGEKSVSSDLYLNGSSDVTIARVAVFLISDATADAESANGKRALVGYDAQGTKYAVVHEDGSIITSDGGKLTYTDSAEVEHNVVPSDIPALGGLPVVKLTSSQIDTLLG